MSQNPIINIQNETDHQDLIEKLLSKNRLLEKRCNLYKKRREQLMIQLYQKETQNKLSESKVSVSSANCNFPTMPDETDLIQRYQEELQQKETLISELKETVAALENKANSLQVCNDEMQYQLSKQQQQEFVRSDKVSQSVIIPKSTSQTEKAMAVIDKFVQPLSTSSFKSTDGKPQSAEEKRKLIKKMSIHAGASAYMMAMKGDYTTLQNASEEMQSNKNLEES
ncbi:unnamed protein product [Paramecium pentaurelia]|uniref:Uncharacterized protein n=1 Tax=Paramecium pentaurelia TaxID=43138 RepID=A0A8S1XSG7_9CILI|nr:unnamed protein product [Paramecium pentaurelia]